MPTPPCDHPAHAKPGAAPMMTDHERFLARCGHLTREQLLTALKRTEEDRNAAQAMNWKLYVAIDEARALCGVESPLGSGTLDDPTARAAWPGEAARTILRLRADHAG